MSGGERVEDTRTLQPGDPVRVVIESEVASTDDRSVGFALGGGSTSPWWFLAHDVEYDNVQVYRLPKPLPPEPPVGAEVLSAGDICWVRHETHWCRVIPGAPPCSGRMPTGLTWSELLSLHGPVRLLGDPIEAPR